MQTSLYPFSIGLEQKLETLRPLQKPSQLGRVHFASPLLLAPMASICNAPFRLLMEHLGAGGTVSELISCHGINYRNAKTLQMLFIDSRERNVGIQLFGEDGVEMSEAALVAQSYGAKFIDINMGCPVKKVVTKGAGSALLRSPKALVEFLSPIKKVLTVPLTIKIRTGWDHTSLNAQEVVAIAQDCGVEFVAIHGRTRAQQYTGSADWNYLESVAQEAPLPIIGNGDLHDPMSVWRRMQNTHCQGLMLARGALRNPFLFLEGLQNPLESPVRFTASDHFEALKAFEYYARDVFKEERHLMVQIRKLILWYAAGLPGAKEFRGSLFQMQTMSDLMRSTEDYFLGISQTTKHLDLSEEFMMSGHG